MAPYSATETHNNRVTADSWIAFTPHRRRVTAILEKLGSNSQSAQRRLCVVGAGNLNDVELSQLQRIYAHIELIDIDLAALERGLRRQMVAPDSPSITLRGVDVLGLSDGMSDDDVLDALASGKAVAAISSSVGRYCDVVAGTALISQLAIAVKKLVLASLTRPGGVVAHVSDLARRSDARGREIYSEAEIVESHMKTGASGDFFAGTNPAMLLQVGLGGVLTDGSFWMDGGQPLFWVWCITSTEQQHLDDGCLVAYALTWRVTRQPVDPRLLGETPMHSHNDRDEL
ncbi:hypothetical protein EMIHUDRAFT_210684 [Emiliania huxleyi CCMP1516]|uniref:Uncharacterized protein n=2 Tax=Emiliania huxleyi TaxID=2903 RepID=A0A0D3IYJ1_EMIH1|nr:hypothetical protein EMIHUDRAFT_210684 [Emiliania huxleyi CCMP1516]EOD16326.1 hypothetical protein EMIHUDRAFT_210684 [Emiliania huxleyi CCMP1516]|eukprot:XP_005768755.1 hypothetical protein EMIHUDRAFT_210684 [Emiliania huxleyi CCMP1516]